MSLSRKTGKTSLQCQTTKERLSKVSFRIYNGESYRQDTNGSCRFEDEMEVRSSDNETDVFVVRTSHEKADAGLILHWHHIRCRTAAMLAKYLQNMQISCYSCTFTIPSPNLWMISGTSKTRKYFNIKAIHGSSPFPCPYKL